MGAIAECLDEKQGRAVPEHSDAKRMRALILAADRKVELLELKAPPAPGAGEVQIRVKAVGLNHLDLWGFRGMAFAKRKMPLVVGAEAASF